MHSITLCDKEIEAIFIDIEETGKPCRERKGEIGGGAQIFREGLHESLNVKGAIGHAAKAQ